MRNRVITQPAVEPITLAEMKTHLRVSTTDQDDLITSLIIAAREYVEAYCGRSLVTQTREQLQDAFIDGVTPIVQYEMMGWSMTPIRVYYGPIQSVSSIKYIDSNGDQQTVDATFYELDIYSEPARIVPAYLRYWPVARYKQDAISITYIAGYPGTGSPLDLAGGIPRMLKAAIKLLVAQWYEFREATVEFRGGDVPIPFGIEALLMPFKNNIL